MVKTEHANLARKAAKEILSVVESVMVEHIKWDTFPYNVEEDMQDAFYGIVITALEDSQEEKQRNNLALVEQAGKIAQGFEELDEDTKKRYANEQSFLDDLVDLMGDIAHTCTDSERKELDRQRCKLLGYKTKYMMHVVKPGERDNQ